MNNLNQPRFSYDDALKAAGASASEIANVASLSAKPKLSSIGNLIKPDKIHGLGDFLAQNGRTNAA